MTCNPHWSRTRIPTRRSGPAWRGGDERGEGRREGRGESGRLRGEGRAKGGSPLTSPGSRRRQLPPRGLRRGVVPPPPHKEIPRTHTPPSPPRAVTQHRRRAHAQRRERPRSPPLAHTHIGRRRARARPRGPPAPPGPAAPRRPPSEDGGSLRIPPGCVRGGAGAPRAASRLVI